MWKKTRNAFFCAFPILSKHRARIFLKKSCHFLKNGTLDLAPSEVWQFMIHELAHLELCHTPIGTVPGVPKCRKINMISIATAMMLTQWSKRTLWRRLSDGTVSRGAYHEQGEKTKIELDAIKEYITIPLSLSDYELIELADFGDTSAQTDLAVLFFTIGRLENAMHWLKIAANQGNPNAMYLLGRCYTDGNGTACDNNLGIMWIAKAAACGHQISLKQMELILNSHI